MGEKESELPSFHSCFSGPLGDSWSFSHLHPEQQKNRNLNNHRSFSCSAVGGEFWNRALEATGAPDVMQAGAAECHARPRPGNKEPSVFKVALSIPMVP